MCRTTAPSVLIYLLYPLMTFMLISARTKTSFLLMAALACCLAVPAHAAVGVDWTLRNPSLTNESFNAVARNGDTRKAPSVLVAVGSHGVILTAASAAGPWAVRSSGTVEDLNSVTWSPSTDLNNDSPVSRFVVVGNKGVTLTSPTGEVWTRVAAAGFMDPSKPATPAGNQQLTADSLAAQDFISVFWTGSQFLAGGNSSAGPVVFTSSDGMSWRKYPGLGAGLKLRSVTGNLGNSLVAVTDKNIQTSKSSAPAPWTVTVFPTDETNVQSMVFSQPTYIMSASKIFTASSIGAWTPQAAPVTDGNLNLTLDIGLSVTKIVGAGANGKVWVSSDNAANWTQVGGSAEAGVQLHGAVDFGADYVAVGEGGRIYRYSAGTWSSLYSAGAVDRLAAVCANGSALVAVGKNVALVSLDGTHWTRNTPDMDASSVIGLGGAGFLATGTGMWSSADGTTWVPDSTVFTGRLNRLITLPDAGKSLAVGADTSVTPLKSLMYTYDTSTTTWTKVPLPVTFIKELRGAAVSPASLIVAVGDGGFVTTSLNGAAWMPHPVTLAINENFTDVLYDGSQFIACTNLGGTWTSPEGAVWTKRQAASGAGLSRLVRATIGPDAITVG
ncbi:MAG: hypothetical protein JWO94_4019, partial [Verrucomicrobiaceae bacterium]|nr:hypothetical protein [Verrucomicrobiaceae bacterium]